MRKIFVFGSNTAGRHGKGAALFAKKNFGAIQGVGEGIQGNSYGIPTKDSNLKVLSLEEIGQSISTFLGFAYANPDLLFMVTRVGCGLAGFKDEQIAGQFALAPENCVFDLKWKPFLGNVYQYFEE